MTANTDNQSQSDAFRLKVPAREAEAARRWAGGWLALPSLEPTTGRLPNSGQLVDQLGKWTERLCPHWAHRRHRRNWEKKWGSAAFSPFWRTSVPQDEVVEAINSGWFPTDQPIIDLGCGSGEVSRWLARQGLAVLGLDYSVEAIETCRRLSAGMSNEPVFEVADLCGKDLHLGYAVSLVDRGCFHRIVEGLRPIFARNVARATLEGGHFLLLAATFQDPRAARYRGIGSEQQLCHHIELIFGSYFAIERAEPAVINARVGERAMPAMAFWMVRRSTVPTGGCKQRLTQADPAQSAALSVYSQFAW